MSVDEKVKALETQANVASDQVRDVKKDNKRLKSEAGDLVAQVDQLLAKTKDFDAAKAEVKDLEGRLSRSETSVKNLTKALDKEKKDAEAGRNVAAALKVLSV